MDNRTIIQDLSEILDYLYKDEIRDFIEHFDKGETDVKLSDPEMEAFVERSKHEGEDAYDDLAAERSIHLVGSILRVGRQLCGWG